MSLLKVCKDLGIPVLSCSPEGWDMFGLPLAASIYNGSTILIEGKPYILCGNSCSREETRYIIAHELGHILLGHLSFREKSGNYAPYMETEANIFAAVLLASDSCDRDQKTSTRI